MTQGTCDLKLRRPPPPFPVGELVRVQRNRCWWGVVVGPGREGRVRILLASPGIWRWKLVSRWPDVLEAFDGGYGAGERAALRSICRQCVELEYELDALRDEDGRVPEGSADLAATLSAWRTHLGQLRQALLSGEEVTP